MDSGRRKSGGLFDSEPSQLSLRRHFLRSWACGDALLPPLKDAQGAPLCISLPGAAVLAIRSANERSQRLAAAEAGADCATKEKAPHVVEDERQEAEDEDGWGDRSTCLAAGFCLDLWQLLPIEAQILQGRRPAVRGWHGTHGTHDKLGM